MKNIRLASAVAILQVCVFVTGAANALYSYSGVVTLCTEMCQSFASLDIGSTINGTLQINTTAGGTFGDADMGAFQFFAFNPALPPSGPVGDPVNDNPLVLDSTLGIGISNGTAGTTNSHNDLNSGQILIEFLVPPFSSLGTFVVIDLATGDGQVCWFFEQSGCIQDETEFVKFAGSFSCHYGECEDPIVPVPAAVWLMGSGVLCFMGLIRRRA